eukprot:CAMPEP_0172298832 /NCGR_PEP_ID=MMETSP1058-20130122/1304_1 /TAXON_ID=83371 /ORGANISM="Detonula confervacea, Strain CCMP 353" /LENGTH=279 /DNA_ID=CAMNT_0013008125 /DNA_START=15 /DNA_END=854 /DNA_ORIENTATION=+
MTPQQQQSGININDALSILSARAKSGGDADITNGSSTVPDELKEMGQTIDIANQMEFAKPGGGAGAGCDCARNKDNEASTDPVVLDEEEEKKHEAMKQERARRGEEIRTRLQSMGVVDLLGMIFRAQQERVATYKMFEKGLSTILISGNMTNYPTLCAKVTASFSVLSDTINSVKSSLEGNNNNNRKDITSVICQLQKTEGEKLNLTAALHLEKLRLRNSQLEVMVASSSSSSSDGAEDDRTVKLLKDGIQTLERKIKSVVESINEVLEELRCFAADEN